MTVLRFSDDRKREEVELVPKLKKPFRQAHPDEQVEMVGLGRGPGGFKDLGGFADGLHQRR
jgi:hypothetical protein